MKKYINRLIISLRDFGILMLVIAICLSPVIIWALASAMEARAYNSITCSDVSTWEAMWVTLRVDGKSN